MTLLMTPLFLFSQFTLTKDWVAKQGDFNYIQGTVGVQDPGPDGPDVNWDFSGVVNDTFPVIGQQYVDADTTAFISEFSDANVCAFNTFTDPDAGSITVYNYSRAANDIWENLGQAFRTSGFGDLTTIYDNPETILTFPFTYQSDFTDDYSFVMDIGVATTMSMGSIVGTCDAYGSLQLPGASFDNVLRIKTVEEQVDSTALGGGLVEKAHTKTTLYIWLSGDHPGPLATLQYNERFTVGIWPPLPIDTSDTDFDTTFYYDPSAMVSSVTRFVSEALDVNLSPNPFSDQLRIEFTLDGPSPMRVEVQTNSGQTVHAAEHPGHAGLNEVTLQLANLPPGLYVALLRGKDQATARRIIKWE